MKHLKIYENYQTEEEVAKICQEYRIRNWSISKDGLVDVDGVVSLVYKELKKLPIKFGIVTGYFSCQCNKLTTLEGAPYSVGGDFSCSSNKLTTLEGAPRSVDGSFYCDSNKLITLEGAPYSVGGDFSCYSNNLTTLEGAPKSVNLGDFNCHGNQLTTLEGAPGSIGGDFDCSDNKKLTTLNGSPGYIGGSLDFINTKITTLEGAPKTLVGNIYFDFYKLPKVIRDNINHIKFILENQKRFSIWNSNGSIDETQFDLMMFKHKLNFEDSVTRTLQGYPDPPRTNKVDDIVSVLLKKENKQFLYTFLKMIIDYHGKDKPKIISKLAEDNTQAFQKLKELMSKLGEDPFKADLNKDMGDLGF